MMAEVSVPAITCARITIVLVYRWFALNTRLDNLIDAAQRRRKRIVPHSPTTLEE